MNEVIANYFKEKINSSKDLEKFRFNFGKHKGYLVQTVFENQFIKKHSEEIKESIKVQNHADLKILSDFSDLSSRILFRLLKANEYMKIYIFQM